MNFFFSQNRARAPFLQPPPDILLKRKYRKATMFMSILL